jgi:hypothetical protein
MQRLALSMIVRDEARTLERCLGSVRGIVDEMVVAATLSRHSFHRRHAGVAAVLEVGR